MPVSENVKKSEISDGETEGLTRNRIFEEFSADRETIATLGVTDVELRELSSASLLGTLTSQDDLMFLLRQIRSAMNPAAAASAPLESIHLPGRQIDEPTRDFGKITETIRSAALAKLDELDLKAARRRRSAIGRLESAWGRLTMTLSLVHSLVARLADELARRSASSRSV